MGVYVEGRSRSAEDQIWERIDRMRDAGPLADYYLAARERRAWAMSTAHPAAARTAMATEFATAIRRWIGTCLIAVGQRLEGTSPVHPAGNGRLMTTPRSVAR